jgi:ABC-type nitrate/sulfonate/bicarbonate transport system substrate-binding protein
MPKVLSRRALLRMVTGSVMLGSSPVRSALALGSPTPITIANASGGLNLTMAALMRQQKFLESFGLAPDVMAVADGTRILAAIVGGNADISMASGFGQVFPAIEHGAGIKILAGGALVPTIAMFTGKPYVNSLKDLEGRTVGTGSIGALVHQLVTALLHKYNVDVSKVRFVNIGSSADVFRAVSVGRVDAGPAAAALISEAASYHVRPIPHGNMTVELPEYTYQGAWTSDHKIATNRDALVRAPRGLCETLSFHADTRGQGALHSSAPLGLSYRSRERSRSGVELYSGLQAICREPDPHPRQTSLYSGSERELSGTEERSAIRPRRRYVARGRCPQTLALSRRSRREDIQFR